MTVRLSNVITTIVDDRQTAFLPGKIIHENIIMAHELLGGYSRKYVSPRCTIQIDLHKVYDTVNLDALEIIMREMNFPARFITWIMLDSQNCIL